MASSVSATVTLVVQLLASLPSAEQTSLLESCSLAHQGGNCVDISEARLGDTLRASVDFSSDTRVTLEITDTDPGRSLYASRELFFEQGDDAEERARAIGLALGVLATTLSKGRPPAKEEEPPPKTDPASAEAPAKEVEDDVSSTKKPPLGRGPWGVSLSGGARFVPSWGVAAPTGAFGLLGYPHPSWGGLLRTQLASFPPSSRNVSMTHVAVTLGPSFRTKTSPFFLSAAFTAGFQSTEARLNVADAEVRKGNHLSPLLQIEAAIGRELTPGVALTLSPAIDILFSDTEILVDDQNMGRTGTTQASLLVGVLLMPTP